MYISLFFRGAYASAMNKVWHPEHFICLSCQKSLSNCTFIFEDDKIFCDQCYENQVAATCFKCKRPIIGVSVDYIVVMVVSLVYTVYD